DMGPGAGVGGESEGRRTVQVPGADRPRNGAGPFPRAPGEACPRGARSTPLGFRNIPRTVPPRPVTVACIGGGPAGLFLSILLKDRRPDWDVAVYEQNPRRNTFGWGIVFSYGTIEYLRPSGDPVPSEPEPSRA